MGCGRCECGTTGLNEDGNYVGGKGVGYRRTVGECWLGLNDNGVEWVV